MNSPDQLCKAVKKIVDNQDEVSRELCRIVAEIANNAIKENGKFTVGLSGGSIAKFLCDGLPSIQTDWSKWRMFFCDERLVPEDHEDSTLRLYLEGLLGYTPLQREQFIGVNTKLEVTDAAIDYEGKIRAHFPNVTWPSFDLLLLGMGPDGHTASLFPGHALLTEDKMWIAPISDSPKPPPKRVTMTFPTINNAKTCIFAMAGEGKAEMIKRILLDKEDLPTTKVQPKNGKLYWILDKSAASKL